MIPTINSKLPNVGTTIFTVMSGLAAELNAVNLGQGYPDYSMNPELVSLVNDAMKNDFNQYVPMQGYMPLREALAEKTEFLYGTKINPASQITITPGGTYAIYTALTTVLQPGDEVIVFQPCYDSYIPNIEINGGIPVLINMKIPDQTSKSYRIDWSEVRQRITPKTRMIMLNTPHNPTGSVLHESDIQELRSIVRDTNILIMCDEVYEHLMYDGLPHQSMLRYPDLLERSFVCYSFGKTYHCTGWKLGYCITSPELTAEFRKVHQFNCFSCHSPSQVALATFLKNRDAYLTLGVQLQAKRDYFTQLMQSTKFELLESNGSYFITARYGRISDEKDSDLAIRLTKEYGVAMIPVSVFYKNFTDNKIVRFCFCKKDETLEKAVERLAKI
jgi:methionine transaminase